MQIKIFEPIYGEGSNEDQINKWLKVNPQIIIQFISHCPMYDLYSNRTPEVCNWWVMTTVVYSE